MLHLTLVKNDTLHKYTARYILDNGCIRIILLWQDTIFYMLYGYDLNVHSSSSKLDVFSVTLPQKFIIMLLVSLVATERFELSLYAV